MVVDGLGAQAQRVGAGNRSQSFGKLYERTVAAMLDDTLGLRSNASRKIDVVCDIVLTRMLPDHLDRLELLHLR